MAKKRRKTKRSKSNYKSLKYLLFAICVGFFCNSFDKIKELWLDPVRYTEKISGIELPKIKDSTYFAINKDGRYSYMYSPKDKQARWVAYMITRSDLKGKSVRRSNDFKPDKFVTRNRWQTAKKDDYYKSTFDRGHLLPSADRNKSKKENKSTYIFSNISPQKAQLNRNPWRLLEEQIRAWANKYDTLYVVTAGVLEDKEMGHIGKNKVTVPHRYYKVVLSVRNNTYNAIGFVLPNSSIVKDDFMQYRMSVNDVERIAKLDFFDKLPDDVEEAVEKDYNTTFWNSTVKISRLN